MDGSHARASILAYVDSVNFEEDGHLSLPGGIERGRNPRQCKGQHRALRFGKVAADHLRQIDVDDATHLIWPCSQMMGLGAVILRFLGLAEKAEERCDRVVIHLDVSNLRLYGDISALFPLPGNVSNALKEAVAAGKELTPQEQVGFSCRRWQSFKNGAGCVDGRPFLSAADAARGRALCRRHVRLEPRVHEVLERYACSACLHRALGVHIRRTDKGSEAPSNLAVSVEEASAKVLRCAQVLHAQSVFLAGDDADFLAKLRVMVELQDLAVLPPWPSRLSERDRPVHYDQNVPRIEAAVDAVADTFCLSRCCGLLSTFSCISVWATIWASNDNFVAWHFRYPQLAGDPWNDDAFPSDTKTLAENLLRSPRDSTECIDQA